MKKKKKKKTNKIFNFCLLSGLLSRVFKTPLPVDAYKFVAGIFFVILPERGSQGERDLALLIHLSIGLVSTVA